MRAYFTLTSSESKRLIAKGVAVLPIVQKALREGTIVVAGGTTNAFVAEELSGQPVEKSSYTAGIITRGYACVTPPERRVNPIVLINGARSDLPWTDAVQKLTPADVFIKGANAIDPEGNVGVLASHPTGGTSGVAFTTLIARGCPIVCPVGLEKLIPSVRDAVHASGSYTMDLHLGQPVGLIPLINGIVVTEIEALNLLFGVDATLIAGGGVGGSEGAVTIAIEGEEERVQAAFFVIKNIKGEPAVPHMQQKCPCSTPCERFN